MQSLAKQEVACGGSLCVLCMCVCVYVGEGSSDVIDELSKL